MIRNNTMDVLLRLGMPARVKGLIYICDAVELFDTDPYYTDGKICSLYGDIAKRHNTTASGVERAIRHAFETMLVRGDQEELEQYLDMTNTQNSNLLRSLYFRMRQEETKQVHTEGCMLHNCAMKEEICQEAMNAFCKELASALVKRLESI